MSNTDLVCNGYRTTERFYTMASSDYKTLKNSNVDLKNLCSHPINEVPHPPPHPVYGISDPDIVCISLCHTGKSSFIYICESLELSFKEYDASPHAKSLVLEYLNNNRL